MSRERVLVDSGFLIALLDRKEPHHRAADAFLRGYRGGLLTVEAVLVETAFFLDPARRARLVTAAADGIFEVASPDPGGRRRIAELLTKYADLDPDYADCALLWRAEGSGCRRILTLDRSDFSVYRIQGGRALNLVDWC